jgi:hypothetical protein
LARKRGSKHRRRVLARFDLRANRPGPILLFEELNRLLDETDSPSEQEWLLDLRDLAEQCRARTHTYLKLLGE